MAGGINRQAINKLTDRKVKAFKFSRESPHRKLSDGGGLYLTHTKAGTAAWRVKYRFNAAEMTYSIGPYPSITLGAARVEREWVREQLRLGHNPVQARNLGRAVSVTGNY